MKYISYKIDNGIKHDYFFNSIQQSCKDSARTRGAYAYIKATYHWNLIIGSLSATSFTLYTKYNITAQY